jgi:predicted nucleotidyltransferase
VSDRIRDVLAEEPSVVAAYLFGSVAEGRHGPLSDIDLGILFAPGAGSDAVGRLTDRLVSRLRTERVDVVPLAEAPIPLRYRCVRHGQELLCRDPVARERFVVDTVMRYLDFKPVRDRALSLIRDAILRGE